MTRAALTGWVAGLLADGAAPPTARSRQLAVRRFAAWLAEEGELPGDTFLGVKSPKLDEQVVEPLTDDELRAMIRACAPPRGAESKVAMRHCRDGGMVRFERVFEIPDGAPHELPSGPRGAALAQGGRHC